jgi:hypothetical protein
MAPPNLPDRQPRSTALGASEAGQAVSNKKDQAVSRRQTDRLVKLAQNFDEAVEALPNGKRYKREQKELAETRKRAQMSDSLLRLRVR